MNVLSISFTTMFTFLILALCNRDLPHREALWVWGGWGVSLLGSVAFMLVTFLFYEGGDILLYHREGIMMAELLSLDFAYYAPALWDVFFQNPSLLDNLLIVPGSSTSTMSALSAVLFFFFGDSLVFVCLVSSWFSFFGRVAIYLSLRSFIQPMRRKFLAIACFLIPSSVFWMGGLLKETFACFGMGWVLWGALSLLQGKRFMRGSLAILIGGIVTIMLKPYVILPTGAALSWFFLTKRIRKNERILVSLLRPSSLIFGGIISLGTIWLVGELFPKFALENVAEEAARLQSFGVRENAGSNYQMGSSSATSIEQQALFLPMALISALFRPFLFEIHNAPALLSGLEMLVAQILVVKGGLKHMRKKQSWRELVTHPALGYCLVFTFLFAAGVGLGTTNLGTLSRYRVPMMPLYAFWLFVFAAREPQRVHESSRMRSSHSLSHKNRRTQMLRRSQ